MMKENTFAVSLTLEDLKRRRLVIPCFQRPYRWTRDEAAVLFDDLMAFQEVAKLDSSIRYSLGTIVTARLDPRGEELFVLDGQQRLTTVALLENVLESHLDKEMADEKAPLPPKWLSYRNLPEGASFPGRWKKAGRKEVFDSNGVRDAFEERLSMSKDDSVGLELLARQVVVDVLIHQSLPQHAGGDKQHRRIERRMCRRTTSPLPFIRTSARKHADLLPAGSLQDV